LEHLTGSFTIGTCDEWGVNVLKSIILEELMGGVCDVVLDSCNCAHDLSSGTQMGDVSESLKSNFLTSQWVLIIVISAKNLDFLEFSAGEFHLDELTFSFGFDHFTCDFEGVVHFGFLDVFPVGYGILDDDLKGSGT
jgi:hypothetical protein